MGVGDIPVHKVIDGITGIAVGDMCGTFVTKVAVVDEQEPYLV